MAVAFIVSMAATAGVGLILTPALRRAKAGQSIREDGPVWHKKKQGTPTMGGIMFIAGVAISCLTVGWGAIKEGELRHIFVLVFAVVFAAVGFLDDFKKLRKKQNMGLSAARKFTLQFVVAIVFIILMHVNGYITSNMFIPFVNVTVQVWRPAYYVFAAFVIVGTVNAVNITDGADGLVSGVSIPVAVCYAFLAAIWGYTALGLFSAALAGGIAAFLFFNFHPARVFMGDTGSLFIGGAICATAIVMDVPLILVPLGLVYFVETLSDIIQITYYKFSHGKRVFKMAPLHHHFEMCGWSEYRLFAVFTAVSAVFAFITYFGAYSR
jgi:phospho-N-acetylmuramoyl-pentapeptide-transferase